MAMIEIILGSKSDLPMLEKSKLTDILTKAGISWKLSVISAHRNLEELQNYCRQTLKEDVQIFIAVAGMAAALPGTIAAITRGHVPVIGVALEASDGFLSGVDALLSMVRMPPGIPVITAGIGKPGLKNAALIACQIIGLNQPEARTFLEKYLTENNKPTEIDIQHSNGE